MSNDNKTPIAGSNNDAAQTSKDSPPTESKSANSPELTLEWKRGGSATLIETDGQYVVFLSTSPAPPGTPLVGSAPKGEQYQVKVRGCKRVQLEPLRYRIEGRFFNLSKKQRARLIAAP